MLIQVYHERLGTVDKDVYELDRAAAEYDENLFLDRHPDTGDWTVYVRLERPGRPFPVFVLPGRLPTKDQLLERLRKADTLRTDVRAQINAANAAWEADIDKKTREEIGKAAEVTEYIARKQYMLSDNTSRRKVVKT